MYANSHRDYFPLTAGFNDDNWFGSGRGAMMPNVNVLICPGTRNLIRPETLHWKVDDTMAPRKMRSSLRRPER